MLDLFKNKCPKCNKGKIFNVKNMIFTFNFSKMNQNCSKCGVSFHKETGYFFGAMYISYALAVLQSILCFLICIFILKIDSINYNFVLVCLTILALSFFNYRMSRIIWIRLLNNL